MTLDQADVRNRIATLLNEYMDIDHTLALQDVPFSDLNGSFDSLAYFELQMLLEKEFDMEFDPFDFNTTLPENVSEMADALIKEYEAHQLRQTKLTDIAASLSDSSASV